MFSQLRLEAYVPERVFFEGKNLASERLCQEEAAVIDVASGYRLLVRHRLADEQGNDLFSAFGIGRSERTFLERSLGGHKRLLLHGDCGEVLILADWISETGLLLALRLPEMRGVFRQALGLMRREEIVFSPFVGEAPQGSAAAIDAAIEHLSELFFYLDRILSPDRSIGLMTRVSLIGSFVGCRVFGEALPVDFPALQSRDTARLSAFLLCSLITLRRQNNPVIATGEGNAVMHRTFGCRLDYGEPECDSDGAQVASPDAVSRVTKRPHADWRETELDFSFLEHEAFREYAVEWKQGSLSLQAPLIPASYSSLLYAAQIPLRLRLILTEAEEKTIDA